jgi:hypothetical protein
MEFEIRPLFFGAQGKSGGKRCLIEQETAAPTNCLKYCSVGWGQIVIPTRCPFLALQQSFARGLSQQAQTLLTMYFLPHCTKRGTGLITTPIESPKLASELKQVICSGTDGPSINAFLTLWLCLI